MVVLIDLVEVVADGQAQELFAMQLVSYLDALRPGRKKSRKVEVPVADRLHQGRPLRGMGQRSRGLRPGQRFRTACAVPVPAGAVSRSICSGVAGSAAKLVDESGQESLIPLRVEPRGIIEPFAWMVSHVS